MYLHLGQSTVITTKELIGIFDMDNTTVMKSTRDYLAQAEKNGEVVNVSYELPKSFAVCADTDVCNHPAGTLCAGRYGLPAGANTQSLPK